MDQTYCAPNNEEDSTGCQRGDAGCSEEIFRLFRATRVRVDAVDDRHCCDEEIREQTRGLWGSLATMVPESSNASWLCFVFAPIRPQVL